LEGAELCEVAELASRNSGRPSSSRCSKEDDEIRSHHQSAREHFAPVKLVVEEENMKKKPLPESVVKFKSKYPEIWKAFAALGEKCHEIGPLDEKTRRLVKLAIAITARHEGAVHSATRNALHAGITPEEMFHAAILSITTIGWPPAYAAMTWINEVITGAGRESILSD
jgi:alkylhydroperoxidase/carboxymuconolactone decarboxylase family protein YurZ